MDNKLTYIPPFTVSAEAINLIAQISAQIERYAIRLEQSDGLRLRKANRIKTISESSRRGDSGPFIDFMLQEILNTLKTHQGDALGTGINVGTNVGINVGTNVGENERKILAIIAHSPQSTAREMAEVLGITLRQCERILASMKQKELIVRIGANKGGHWEIVHRRK